MLSWQLQQQMGIISLLKIVPGKCSFEQLFKENIFRAEEEMWRWNQTGETSETLMKDDKEQKMKMKRV